MCCAGNHSRLVITHTLDVCPPILAIASNLTAQSLPAYIIPSAAKSTPEDAVPSSKNAGQHWPDIQYRYGCIVDSILQARQAEDQTCASSKILDDLSSWYKSVAEGQHEPNRSPVTTSSARHAAISSSYQYHEAVLSVLLHESVSDTQGTQMEIPQSIVMESIRDIFSASNLIENHLYDRYVAEPANPRYLAYSS